MDFIELCSIRTSFFAPVAHASVSLRRSSRRRIRATCSSVCLRCVSVRESLSFATLVFDGQQYRRPDSEGLINWRPPPALCRSGGAA